MKIAPVTIIACLLIVTFSLVATGSAQIVTKIAGGENHSLFLKSDGSLWGMGASAWGELGDNNYVGGVMLPEQIVASNVIAVATGQNHSLFIKNDGSLWGMGFNLFGGLGDGTFSTNYPFGIITPEQIVSSNVTAIAVGNFDSYFIKSDGSLWAMGRGDVGQLGDGNYYSDSPGGISFPEMIVASNVVAVTAGQTHALFLKSDGSLWAMGANVEGELGDGTFSPDPPYGTNRPEMIVPTNVVAIAAGYNHSLFIKTDGSLWGMGFNYEGQLGVGLFSSNYPSGINQPILIVSNNVTAIAAGAEHSLFLKSDGSAWGMGNDSAGQFGDGLNSDYLSYPLYNSAVPKQIFPANVIAISAGAFHSLFVLNDGSLWGAGDNRNGQLGDGTSLNLVNVLEEILPGPPAFNRITGQLLADGSVRLSFLGLPSSKYALDRSLSFAPANWISQATNTSAADGTLAFTNTPVRSTNNFWRVRSVP